MYNYWTLLVHLESCLRGALQNGFKCVVNLPELWLTGRARLIRTRLIRSSTLFEVCVKCFPVISCLKRTVNSYFHLFRRKILANEWLQINRAQPVFTLPGSVSDSKPDGYIVLYRSFHTDSDPDPDPSSDGFPNGYCTRFRDRSLSQGQMSIPILLYFNQGIRVRIWTNGEFLHSTVIRFRVWIQIRVQQSKTSH